MSMCLFVSDAAQYAKDKIICSTWVCCFSIAFVQQIKFRFGWKPGPIWQPSMCVCVARYSTDQRSPWKDLRTERFGSVQRMRVRCHSYLVSVVAVHRFWHPSRLLKHRFSPWSNRKYALSTWYACYESKNILAYLHLHCEFRVWPAASARVRTTGPHCALSTLSRLAIAKMYIFMAKSSPQFRTKNRLKFDIRFAGMSSIESNWFSHSTIPLRPFGAALWSVMYGDRYIDHYYRISNNIPRLLIHSVFVWWFDSTISLSTHIHLFHPQHRPSTSTYLFRVFLFRAHKKIQILA